VGRGYEIVTQWQTFDHDQAASIERQTIAYWRAHGWPQVDATPKDGRTETVSSDHLPERLAWLARLLEVEPVATEEPGMPTVGRTARSQEGSRDPSAGIPAEGLDRANAGDDGSPQDRG
jgi:hypothetical protein